MNQIYLRETNSTISIQPESRRIVGLAIPYETMGGIVSDLGPAAREIVRKGAFARSIANDDIVALVGHDKKMVLGRTNKEGTGTLVLRTAPEGIYAEVDVPETSYGNDLLVSIARGDIKGWSFGFRRPKTDRGVVNGEKVVYLTDGDLFEVTLSAFPVHSDTTLALREEETAKTSAETSATKSAKDNLYWRFRIKDVQHDVETQNFYGNDAVQTKK